MDSWNKDPALLFHEIPLHWGCLRKSRPENIFVSKRDATVEEGADVTFMDAGGGVNLQVADLTRVICWRTHGSTLELLEYSMDMDLHSNHFVITFDGSKVLPHVRIALVKNQLTIVCCTLNAVHCISIDIRSSVVRPQNLKANRTYPSLLAKLPSHDFQDLSLNHMFHIQGQVQGFAAAALSESERIVAVNTSAGNFLLVKMVTGADASSAVVSQSSRMSRLWSGINPWAGAAGSDAVADMGIVVIGGKAYIAAVCKDHKLRLWSCQTHEQLRMVDLPGDKSDGEGIPDAKACEYKIRVSCNKALLSIYVGVSGQGRFLQFGVGDSSSSEPMKVEFLSHVSSPAVSAEMPHRHLVDYCLDQNNRLVVLWRDIEETESVSVCKFDVGSWHDVANFPPPTPEILLQPHQDVREAYINYIFGPQRFSPAAICRALSIHRKSASSFGAGLGMQDLKERVSAHIQQEIQNLCSGQEEEIDEDAVQLNAWNTFYQTCIQYQQMASRSLGLTVNISGKSGCLISIIKKEDISVLTPVSALEAVCRGCDPSMLSVFLQSEGLMNADLSQLSKLLQSLGTLNAVLGSELLDALRQNISLSGSNVLDVIDDAMPDILCVTKDMGEGPGIEDMLADIDDVSAMIKILLICLEPSDFGVESEGPDSESYPLGSLGVEMLACCVLRHVENRFELATLLCVLSAILETSGQSTTQGQDDRVQLASRVTSYLLSFRSLCWLSSVQAQTMSPTSLENTMEMLSVHDVDDNLFAGPKESKASSITLGGHGGYNSLLEFFVATEGGKFLKAFLKIPREAGVITSTPAPEYLLRSYTEQSLCEGVTPAAVNHLVQLLWPLGPTLVLPDFLLSYGQHTLLQRYLQREVAEWCDWCPKSRYYMLGHCHLYHGNYGKAVHAFILAAPGIGVEEYLTNKLLREDEDSLHPLAKEIIFYTKVLQILEKMDLPEQVITVAHHAIEVAKCQEQQDPNLPILWSSIFRQNNRLRRYSEAFKAILFNSDPDHRKDCLRTLAVSLCENKMYAMLIQFQYDDMEADLVSILEHRARGSDLALSSHNYYDLIYAFHVHRGNFRRAASAMYEQAFRLGCEFTLVSSSARGSIDILQRQLDSYASCINCLYLVVPENRWILHPVSQQVGDAEQQQPGYTSPKRQHDGGVAPKPSRKVIIKELEDIRKEALLTEMKIKLETLTSQQNVCGPLVSPTEIVTLLCHTGLYDDAIVVSTRFELSLAPVFSSLANKCAKLPYADEKGISEAWEWLRENETARTRVCNTLNKASVSDSVFRLLQVYLENHGDEETRGTLYYHAVAKSLLSLSATLPAWFVNAYKERNCPELLRLLVCFDRLEEATGITIERINAARLRVGTDFYGAAPTQGHASWLPYSIIDQLLYILEDLQSEEHFAELYRNLNDSLDEYLHVAETVSDDIMQSAFQHSVAVM